MKYSEMLAALVAALFLFFLFSRNSSKIDYSPAPESVPIPTETITSIPTPTITPESISPFLAQRGALRDYYKEGECELAAKTWQREWGGQLVFVAPYKTSTGQLILGSYAGAWLNIYRGIYVDYTSKQVFTSKSEAQTFYSNGMKNKFNSADVDVKIYVYGQDAMPYPIQYHYS